MSKKTHEHRYDYDGMCYVCNEHIEYHIEELQTELANVLEVSIARGESLGYEDDDYRDRLEDLREIIGERGMR